MFQAERGQSDPMNVDAINSLAWKSENDHRVHETAVSSAVETIFRETALVPSHHPIAMARSANRASHGPRVLAKERLKKMRNGKSKGRSSGSKSAKVSYESKSSKTGLSGLDNPKAKSSQETLESPQTCHTLLTLTFFIWRWMRSWRVV